MNNAVEEFGLIVILNDTTVDCAARSAR